MTKTDEVSDFSNVSPLLSLLAPGSSILSLVPGGSFDIFDGTSMAAPHVAGAWAILKQLTPNATVDQLLVQLQQTGVPITDTRYGTGLTKPRINVAGALGIQYAVPVLDSIQPSTVTAWGPQLTLTVHGADFARASRVRVNGVNRATTYVNETTLTALVPASDLATTASGLSITVFSPTRGRRLRGADALADPAEPDGQPDDGAGRRLRDRDAHERAGGLKAGSASSRWGRPTGRGSISSGSTWAEGSPRARGR